VLSLALSEARAKLAGISIEITGFFATEMISRYAEMSFSEE
jgi:hypothetical protein